MYDSYIIFIAIFRYNVELLESAAAKPPLLKKLHFPADLLDFVNELD